MEEEYWARPWPECWDVWDTSDAKSLARDYCLGKCAEDPSEEECVRECLESECVRLCACLPGSERLRCVESCVEQE